MTAHVMLSSHVSTDSCSCHVLTQVAVTSVETLPSEEYRCKLRKKGDKGTKGKSKENKR